jgi:hypothetical protein
MRHRPAHRCLCLVDVVGEAGANAAADKKTRIAAFRRPEGPSDSIICARLPSAKTRPSAISAEIATLRLRNAARTIGGSGRYSVCDLYFATKVRMSPNGLPGSRSLARYRQNLAVRFDDQAC